MQNLNLDFMLADLTRAKKRARAATANIEEQLQTYFTAIFMKIAADDTERVIGEHPNQYQQRLLANAAKRQLLVKICNDLFAQEAPPTPGYQESPTALTQ